MYNNKYFLAIYGEGRESLNEKVTALIGTSITKTQSTNCDIYVNQLYDTGLPDKPIWSENIGLLLHGIVFPWDMSLDDFAKNPEPYLKETIDKYKSNLSQIARGFRNGSFAGLVINDDDHSLYAFTCFLNSIPVYYSLVGDCLIVSSDYYLVARLTDSKLDKLTKGLLEYYVQGTNLLEDTAFDHIKAIPSGAYIKFSNKTVTLDYYYTLPSEEESRSFEEWVDDFAQKWQANLASMSSEKYTFGVGFTGGIDSRLIFAGLKDKTRPVLYTGPHKLNSDYLLASNMAKKLKLTNHVLEDLQSYDRLKGLAEYYSLVDYPITMSMFYNMGQVDFRKAQHLTYELLGGTEHLGGFYYYTNRQTIMYAIKKSLPIIYHRFKEKDFNNYYKLMRLGFDKDTFEDDLKNLGRNYYKDYLNIVKNNQARVLKQLNTNGSQESFLERFRLVFKMGNMQRWQRAGLRRNCESITPGMSSELLDFASRIPLKHRENRKILFAYLNKFHPDLAKFTLASYGFSPSTPWIVFKVLAPYIKDFNFLGYKIPFFQSWYIKKHDYQSVEHSQEAKAFQRSVIRESDFLKECKLIYVLDKYPDDNRRLIRLFNIAVLEKRLLLGEDELKKYLLGKVDSVRNAK